MSQQLSVNPATPMDEDDRMAMRRPSGRRLPRRRRQSAVRSSSGHAATLAFGRVLFGGYFLYNGVNHFRTRSAMTQYAASKDVPAPDLAVMASGALLVLGGLSVLTGMRPKAGASLIAAFLLGVTPTMHAFWSIEDEQRRMQEYVNFAKNVGLLGGAALAAAVPEPWPASLDGLRAVRRVARESETSDPGELRSTADRV
jgi:uncharacterized membrane protein YphA (DoxX/SURF4 family)